MLSPRRKPHPESLLIGGLLTALIALGQLATAIYAPSMPSLAGVFGTTAETVALTLTVFLAGFAVSQLVFGPLSDRFGRRPVLLWGVVLFLIGSLGCALSNGIGALIAWRFVQSVGACSGAVLGRAIVRDIYGRERAAKALAYIGIAFSVSPAVSPIIGGYLQVWYGWRSPFLFLTGIGLILLALGWTLLSESNKTPDPNALAPGAMLRNFRVLLTDRTFLGYMAALSLTFSGLMAFVASAPFLIIEQLHLSPDHFGLLAALTSAGTLAGNLSAGTLTTRLGTRRMVAGGCAISLAGALIMAGFGLAGHFGIWLVMGPMIVFLWGMGTVMPNAMAGAIGPFARMTGAASALLGFFQMAAGAAAGMIAGGLPHDTQWPLGMMMVLLAGSSLLLFAVLVRRRAEPSEAVSGNP